MVPVSARRLVTELFLERRAVLVSVAGFRSKLGSDRLRSVFYRWLAVIGLSLLGAFLLVAKPAQASDLNQPKQCAATPALALAQIRGLSAPPRSDLINPNTASLSELMTLPGVGPTKARAIIAYRQQMGAFSRLDEITQVSGIGEKTYAKFKDRLTLAP